MHLFFLIAHPPPKKKESIKKLIRDNSSLKQFFGERHQKIIILTLPTSILKYKNIKDCSNRIYRKRKKILIAGIHQNQHATNTKTHTRMYICISTYAHSQTNTHNCMSMCSNTHMYV